MFGACIVADTKRANIEEMLSPRFLEIRCASAIRGAGMLSVSFAVFMLTPIRAVVMKYTRIFGRMQSLFAPVGTLPCIAHDLRFRVAWCILNHRLEPMRCGKNFGEV